jgi:polyhydroxyalkanoate synthesis regulator phasin
MRFFFRLSAITLCFSSLACVSADSLNRQVGMQAYGYQEDLRHEHGRTEKLLSQRSRLQAQLNNAESRKSEIESGGVTPAEQAEMARVHEKIQTLKRTLAQLAAAG